MRCTHPGRSSQRSGRLGQDSSGCASRLLLPEERVVSDPVALHGWRYESAEVTYDRKTLMVGGPVLFVLTGAVSALRNRSARRAAETDAAPRWRPLGPLTVLPTTDRLLVWHQDAWWSVWYSAIEQATCRDQQLQLRFLDASPYLLVGDVSPLANAIALAQPVAAGG
jgi:hypothetical protein